MNIVDRSLFFINQQLDVLLKHFLNTVETVK